MCLLLLLPLPLYGSVVKVSEHQDGTLAGSMAYVDEAEKKWLANASKVTVELEHEGNVILLVSDDLGDYIVELKTGTYHLKSARNADGKQLRFAPSQHECFKVEPNKTTRFDITLLKP